MSPTVPRASISGSIRLRLTNNLNINANPTIDPIRAVIDAVKASNITAALAIFLERERHIKNVADNANIRTSKPPNAIASDFICPFLVYMLTTADRIIREYPNDIIAPENAKIPILNFAMIAMRLGAILFVIIPTPSVRASIDATIIGTELAKSLTNAEISLAIAFISLGNATSNPTIVNAEEDMAAIAAAIDSIRLATAKKVVGSHLLITLYNMDVDSITADIATEAVITSLVGIIASNDIAPARIRTALAYSTYASAFILSLIATDNVLTAPPILSRNLLKLCVI